MKFQNTSRTLEITIFSCEDLRNDRKSVKKNSYVVVRTDHLNSRATKIDTEGGSYPSWNEKLMIDMPLHERFIILEAHCKTSSCDRIIAAARMPVTDFTGGYLPDNYLNILSYRLTDARGERNGIINLSVKVTAPEYLSKGNEKQRFPENNGCSSKAYASLINGGGGDGGEKNSGVVTGIPVWSASLM
ncbi:BON1-associated protein 2-like [Mercurialis annua]|uniref:BON1-associated protein 2-like n=1 Tax=Mercurialis annua TaxID=3986 RepID=UPI002160BA6C|nr:BON1-associated protein 2-like [Mercurialis annua]